MLPHISCEMNLSANRDIYCLVNCWQFYWAWNEIKIHNNTSIIFKEWHNKMLHIIAQCCLCSWQMIAVERLKIALTSWRRNSSESNITVAFPYVLAFCTPHTYIHMEANRFLLLIHICHATICQYCQQQVSPKHVFIAYLCYLLMPPFYLRFVNFPFSCAGADIQRVLCWYQQLDASSSNFMNELSQKHTHTYTHKFCLKTLKPQKSTPYTKCLRFCLY